MSEAVVTGMILSSMPIGDFDKRIVILTKENGKISAFAKGARKPNSALLACTQPFTFAKFKLYVGRNSYNLMSAEVGNYFQKIKEDLSSVYYGIYFCEFAEYVTREVANEREILKLLYVTFLALLKDLISKELIRLIYEVKMISICGYAPHVFSCLKCDQSTGEFTYSHKLDGLVCNKCKKTFKLDGLKLSKTSVYTLKYIIQTDIKKLYSFNISKSILSELSNIMKNHIEKHIEYRFKSYEMLKHIDNIS